MNYFMLIILQRKAPMKSWFILQKVNQCMQLAAIFLTAAFKSRGAVAAAGLGLPSFFRYNIENIVVNTTTTPGTWNVKVIL